jgi:hypothetical protein
MCSLSVLQEIQMPVDVLWDNEEKTVIRIDVRGKWTTEEARTARLDTFKMFDTVKHRVDVIWHFADEESRTHTPNGLLTVFASMNRAPHPQRGMIVFTPKRQDRLAQIWRDMVTKAFPRLRRNTIGADTLDEARALIKSRAEESKNS